jgi:hypothetical protein
MGACGCRHRVQAGRRCFGARARTRLTRDGDWTRRWSSGERGAARRRLHPPHSRSRPPAVRYTTSRARGPYRQRAVIELAARAVSVRERCERVSGAVGAGRAWEVALRGACEESGGVEARLAWTGGCEKLEERRLEIHDDAGGESSARRSSAGDLEGKEGLDGDSVDQGIVVTELGVRSGWRLCRTRVRPRSCPPGSGSSVRRRLRP